MILVRTGMAISAPMELPRLARITTIRMRVMGLRQNPPMVSVSSCRVSKSATLGFLTLTARPRPGW